MRTFGEYFREFGPIGHTKQAGQRLRTGGFGRGFQRPPTPKRPPTPTFDKTTGEEVPQKAPPLVLEPETAPSQSVSEGYGAPTQPAPQPTAETPAAAEFSSSGSSGKSMYGYKAPQSSQQFWNQIFSPVSGTLEAGYGQLGEAVGQFGEEAGNLRTFEGLGGEEMLRRAVESGDPAAMEAARAAVGAQYTGPTGLDPETLAALQREFQDIAPYAQNLSSVAGVEALLEQARPGLSSGARRIEAQRLLESPEFKDITRTLGRDIGALGGETEAEKLAAEDYARQRAESESEISRLAREALTSQRGTIDEELQRRIDEENQKRQQAAEAYDYYVKTGDASRLQALDLGFEPQALETEYTKLDREARAAREAIMSKPEYAQIAELPLMGLGISKHGHKRYQWDESWWEANKDALTQKYGKKGVSKLKALAEQRQRELEAAGFDIGGRNRGAGKYAGAENIFGEDVFDPYASLNQFVSYEPGSVATRQNIASEVQRSEYNRIQDLLGQADKLEATDPYQASQIRADLDAWAEDQRQQYENARSQLEALGYSFETALKETRKAYKKAKKKETAGYIGGGIGAVLGTLIGGPAGGAVGYSLGSQVGESTV